MRPHVWRVIRCGMRRGDDNPAILRGPMVGKFLSVFIGGVSMFFLMIVLPTSWALMRRQRLWQAFQPTAS